MPKAVLTGRSPPGSAIHLIHANFRFHPALGFSQQQLLACFRINLCRVPPAKESWKLRFRRGTVPFADKAIGRGKENTMCTRRVCIESVIGWTQSHRITFHISPAGYHHDMPDDLFEQNDVLLMFNAAPSHPSCCCCSFVCREANLKGKFEVVTLPRLGYDQVTVV